MAASIGAIADTLIDLHHVSAVGADLASSERVFNSVLQRLSDLDAIAETVDEETGEHTIDVEKLLVAIASVQHYLIENLAEARDVDPETIRFELREFAARLDED